jgi:3-oxoacyl-[acyl-carrier protein] reductase
MHVFITGGSKGIGLAIAEELLSLDERVKSITLCSRHGNEAITAAEALAIRYPGSSVLGLSCDVSDESQVATAFETARKKFGPVTVLVNNAGFGKFGLVHEMSSNTFREVFDTNLTGVFNCTLEALPDLKSTAGSVVTISSLAGKQGFVSGGAYSASKFGVRGLMQSLFLDVREHNVRVITVLPGSVNTDFFSAAGVDHLKAPLALTSEEVAQAVVSALLLPSTATVSELDIRPSKPR